MRAAAGAGQRVAAAPTFGRRTVKRLPLPDPGARRFDAAAVQLDDALCQRESDSQAAGRMILRRAQLREHAEHLRQILGRDADAAVFDR